jgi:hypothetical protein
MLIRAGIDPQFHDQLKRSCSRNSSKLAAHMQQTVLGGKSCLIATTHPSFQTGIQPKLEFSFKCFCTHLALQVLGSLNLTLQHCKKKGTKK